MIHQALEHEEFQASQTINGKPVIGISPVHMNLASDTVAKLGLRLGLKRMAIWFSLWWMAVIPPGEPIWTAPARPCGK